jgi:hypothetical protein
LLVNRSGIQTPPWKIRAGRPTQTWIIAEITKYVNKKTRKKKIIFSFSLEIAALFGLWQNEQIQMSTRRRTARSAKAGARHAAPAFV